VGRKQTGFAEAFVAIQTENRAMPIRRALPNARCRTKRLLFGQDGREAVFFSRDLMPRLTHPKDPFS
jgi:hypothetical protein